MKRLTFFALIVCLISICGCSSPPQENYPPVVTIWGNDTIVVIQYSSSTYNDPGATGNDDSDGEIPVTINGSVDMNSAGKYVLKYSATDSDDNPSIIQTRIVFVDGAQYISYNYFVADFSDSIPTGNYSDTITVDSLEFNSVFFRQFAGYINCYLHATTSGTTLTIPSQTLNCGSPLADRTFSGTGLYSKDYNSFTIYYTETTNSVTKNGHCIYTKN